MKEHPILFSGPMVRAILAGLKWHTRRVIRVPTGKQSDWTIADLTVAGEATVMATPKDGESRILYCPYGFPGDKLWVRETWGIRNSHEELVGFPLFEYERPDTESKDELDKLAAYEARQMRLDDGYTLVYAWDGIDYKREDAGKHSGRWRPSIHMPRWASRITPGVVNTRVERVQDISRDDVSAEGLQPGFANLEPPYEWNWQAHFRSLWDSINAKRGYGWDTNPWVWVVEFERLKDAAEG